MEAMPLLRAQNTTMWIPAVSALRFVLKGETFVSVVLS